MTDRPILDLVPGDDWQVRLTLTDGDGDPANFSGWTVEVAIIEWDGGSTGFGVDLTDAANGAFDLSATDTQTADVPIGALSRLTLKLRSVSAIDTTVYVATVRGVETLSEQTAAALVPGAPGIPVNFTISTDPPSGGQDGDLWLQIPST